LDLEEDFTVSISGDIAKAIQKRYVKGRLLNNG